MKKTLLASFVAVVMVVGAASPASALSITDIQSQIQTLLARVAELQAQLRQYGTTGTNEDGASVVQHSNTGSSIGNSEAMPRVCERAYQGALTVGARGDYVKSVQEFLRQQGLLDVEATGYFGELTQAALRRFQSDQGVVSSGTAATTGWGTLGPRTWAAIRARCGYQHTGTTTDARFAASPQRGPAPLTVTFSTNTTLSNPGMIADAGDYKITYGDGTEYVFSCTGSQPSCPGPHTVTHTYTSDGTYTARLVHFGFFGIASESVNGVTVAERVISVGSDSACTEEYAPVCGSKQVVCITTPCNPVQQTYSNRCKMEVDGATFLYEGQCRDVVDPSTDRRCRTWYDGCNTCSRESADSPAYCTLRACFVQGAAYCTAYFDTTENGAPVITGFSGPTTLNVSQTGTWSVSARDPEGGVLSYEINWGDSGVNPLSALQSLASDFTQQTTFTHAYNKAGTYTVTIVVRDGTGKSAKTSTTVRVGSGDVACTEEYAPVCGQPPEPACRNTPPYCAIATPGPQTYANLCFLNAAGATFKYTGACETYQSGTCTDGSANCVCDAAGNCGTSEPVACTQDAYQCPNGTWVGRTGSNCAFVCPESNTGSQTFGGTSECDAAGNC